MSRNVKSGPRADNSGLSPVVWSPVSGAEDLARERDHLHDAHVGDAIEDARSVLARLEQAVVAQDREVLRDVALRRADRLDDLRDRELLVAHEAEDLQPQGMRHGLHRARRLADVVALADE